MNIDTEVVIAAVRDRPTLWDASDRLYKDRDARSKAWHEVCVAQFERFDELPDCDRKVIEKDIKQRWKTARDAYVRCNTTMRNEHYGLEGGPRKHYVYYDRMQFLSKKQEGDEDTKEKLKLEYDDDKIVGIAWSIDREQESPSEDSSQNFAFVVADKDRKSEEKRKRKRDAINECEDSLENLSSVSADKNVTEEEKGKRKRDGAPKCKAHVNLMKNDDMAFFYSLLPITRKFSDYNKLQFRMAVLSKAMEYVGSDPLANVTNGDR